MAEHGQRGGGGGGWSHPGLLEELADLATPSEGGGRAQILSN